MKKLLRTLVLALSALMTSNFVVKTSTAGAVLYCGNALSQTAVITFSSNFADTSWTLYHPMSPLSSHGNRIEPFVCDMRKIAVRKRFYLDTVGVKNAGPILGGLLWTNTVTGQVHSSSVNNLTLSLSNISGLTSTLSSITGSLNGKLNSLDTVGKWMPQGATYDRSNTNELQTLIHANKVITLSSANSITLDIPDQYNPSAGSGISITGTYPYQTITNTGVISESDPTVSSAAKSISASDISTWNSKMNAPAGTTAQYMRGDGSLATFPTTNSSFSNTAGYITGYTPTLTSSNGSIGAVGGNTVAVSITSAQINSAMGGSLVTQQYSATAGEGIVVTQLGPNSQRVAVDTAVASSGTNAIMYVGKANTAIGSINTAIGTKLSTSTFNSTSVTINGTTQAIASNPSFTIPTGAGTTYTSGTGISISGSTITNTAPNQTVNLVAGNGIVIAGTYPNFTISMAAPSITANPARSTTTNSANNTTGSFTVSTKPSFVLYSVNCQVTNPLLIGTSSATVFLEYSTNGGSSWTSYNQNGASSGVGVTVTIQLTTGQTGLIGGHIPAGANVRIRYATAGSATVSYISGQETTY